MKAQINYRSIGYKRREFLRLFLQLVFTPTPLRRLDFALAVDAGIIPKYAQIDIKNINNVCWIENCGWDLSERECIYHQALPYYTQNLVDAQGYIERTFDHNENEHYGINFELRTDKNSKCMLWRYVGPHKVAVLSGYAEHKILPIAACMVGLQRRYFKTYDAFDKYYHDPAILDLFETGDWQQTPPNTPQTLP